MTQSTENILKDTFFLVQANSYEQQKLWEENQKHWKFTWEQQIGLWEEIGRLNRMPVCITLMPILIAGYKVIFWELTSLVCDYRMSEKFFKKYNCKPTWDNGTRLAMTDPSNFHNVAHAIQNLNP